jgi:hypothetical protein
MASGSGVLSTWEAGISSALASADEITRQVARIIILVFMRYSITIEPEV